MPIYGPFDAGGEINPNVSEETRLDGIDFTVASRDGAITVEPPLAENGSLETSGNTEPITDQCGHTENPKNGDTGWSLTVSGFITDAQLDRMKTLARYDEPVKVTHPLETGEFIVSDPTFTVKPEFQYLSTPSNRGGEKVFGYQLQFKEPST